MVKSIAFTHISIMRLLVIFLAIYSCFVSAQHRGNSTKAYSQSETNARRALLTPPDNKSNFAFYFTTFPVDGLDPAIYRRDMNGALVMVGLTGCSGCLCYSKDHRYPVSWIQPQFHTTDELRSIARLMHMPENYQYISYRANLFKSNNSEASMNGLMDMFSCDASTEQLLIEGADELQNVLIADMKFHQGNYLSYCNTLLANHEAKVTNKLLTITEELKRNDPEAVRQELNYRAAEIAKAIEAVKHATSPKNE